MDGKNKYIFLQFYLNTVPYIEVIAYFLAPEYCWIDCFIKQTNIFPISKCFNRIKNPKDESFKSWGCSHRQKIE